MVVAFLLLTLISCTTYNDRTPASASRPPQYVLLSFDGSKSLSMWQNILDFSQEMRRQGKPLQYTFFVSAVYFITPDKKHLYNPKGNTIFWRNGNPIVKRLKDGDSAIGYADSKEGIKQRISFMNRAIREGHEIGSHAVGHWHGGFEDKRKGVNTEWSHSVWMNEFREFNDLVFNWKRNNGIRSGEDLTIDSRDIKGFRAPQLGVSRGLWSTLKEFNYSYDTSEVSDYTSWPKIGGYSGAWNMDLGYIPIAGTSKRTIAMDYNFYVRHKRTDDPAKNAYYENQVYESYMNYFFQNYYGNRAPVVIGHHFSLWNKAAYWDAYKKFARNVCGRAEVKCITHQQFTVEMSRQSSSTINKWRSGNFPRLARRKSADPEYMKLKSKKLTYDLSTKFASFEKGVTLAIDGKDRTLPYKYEFTFNGKKISGKKLHNIGDYMKAQKVERALIEGRVYHKNDEVSVETRAIKVNADGTVKLADQSFEERFKHDHHLAHDGDIDQVMKHYLEDSID